MMTIHRSRFGSSGNGYNANSKREGGDLITAGSKLAVGFACLLLLLFSFPPTLHAQSTAGTSVGTITDTTGAAISGATVTLTNVSTGDARASTTNATGAYQFVNLQPGSYKIDVDAAGFKHYTQTNITIQVGSSTRIDAKVQVGTASETVEVTSQAALLETQQATVGQVVEGRSVTEMPLNGRNVLNLVAVAPGVVPLQNVQSADASTGMRGGFAGGNYMISGGIPNAGAQFLDGGTFNTGYINSLAFVPSQDAVQEFKVEGNNISPEYGGTENGVITMVTKGGTNQLHGSAFEYFRNTVLNANTFFGNHAGLKRPPFIQNQFGATIGGPIKKDKLFFFFSYEATRESIGTTTAFTVPTDSVRSGVFPSAVRDPGTWDPTYTTFTPYTSANCPVGDTVSGTICTFGSNTIPSNRQDPTSVAMLAWWAHAQTAAASNNYTVNLITHPIVDQYLGRVDWTKSDRQRLFVRYLWQDAHQNGAPPYGYMPNVRNNNNHAISGVMGDDITLNPTTILNFRIAYLRWVSLQIPACAPCNLAFTGWSPSLIAQMIPSPGIPLVTMSGYSNNGGASQTIPAADDNDAISGSVTKILGRHTLKFGAEWRRQPNNYGQTQNGTVEAFTFSANKTLTTAFSDNAFANYLLGLPSKTNELTALFPAAMDYYSGAYFNDNFQLNSKLSINAGVRWDYTGYWTERHDRQTAFQPTVASPLASNPGLAGLMGNVVLVNSVANPSRTNLKPHYDLFSPRLGVAYRLTDKTVLRSGFGIVFAATAIIEQNAQPYNSPLNTAVTLIAPTTTPLNAFHNPYPAGLGGILQPVGRSANYQSVVLGQTFDSPIAQQPATYIEQWNVDLEHDFGHQIVLDVAYVGLKGEHLQAPGGGNDHGLGLDQIDNKYLICGTDSTQSQCGGHLLGDQIANPFLGLIPNGALSGAKIAYGQMLRPFPQYVNIYNPANAQFFTIYKSLQAKVQKRMGSGGNLLLSYTWSSNRGNADSTTAFTGSAPGYLQDFNHPANEVSQLTFNLPQVLVGSYVVDLPFGKGKRFLANENGVVETAVSGWGVNGITTYDSGYPVSLTEQTAPNLVTFSYGGGVPRPDYVAGCSKKNTTGSAASRITGWFNAACFTQSAAYAFGNEPRVDPDLRTMGVANWDVSLYKGTQIGDRFNVQFRAEMFNTFNRVQLGMPNAVCCTATNSQFGVISTQQNNPRQAQFALKVTY